MRDSSQRLNGKKSHVSAPTSVHHVTCWTRPQTTNSVATKTPRVLSCSCLLHAFACGRRGVEVAQHIHAFAHAAKIAYCRGSGIPTPRMIRSWPKGAPRHTAASSPLEAHLVSRNVDNMHVTKSEQAPSRWMSTYRVRWGVVLSLPIYPWYFTWVSLAAAVFMFAWGGLFAVTDERWMTIVAFSAIPIFWSDIIATTVIIYRRNRHNRPIKNARKAREEKARKAQKA